MPRAVALLLALLAALVVALPAQAAQRRVPQGWLGVTADGPFRATDAREWDRMVAAGVESVRFSFRWSTLQPYPSADKVPAGEESRFHDVGGVPTDFTTTDAIVSTAARRRLAVLPVVESVPTWAALHPSNRASIPEDVATFRRFLGGLVARYGPAGSLWRERPDLPPMPIRAWQIFNEPNLSGFWSEQPFAPSYVRVLRVAEEVVHGADPGAKVVLAGLPNRSWTALRSIYRAGGGGLFDAVALHPYTARPANVLRLVRYARREMRAHGDRRLPIWITEFTWTAARNKVRRPDTIATTNRGQARKLAGVLRRFVAARRRARIERVFWYTWLSAEARSGGFHWSGLRRLRAGSVVSTPALATFRRWARRLEGCRKAPGDAGSCR